MLKDVLIIRKDGTQSIEQVDLPDECESLLEPEAPVTWSALAAAYQKGVQEA